MSNNKILKKASRRLLKALVIPKSPPEDMPEFDILTSPAHDFDIYHVDDDDVTRMVDSGNEARDRRLSKSTMDSASPSPRSPWFRNFKNKPN